jgi:Phospholipase_D-nuclease N-terminal
VFLSDGFPVLVFLVFGVVVLVTTGLWIWSLVDALRITDQQWDAAGQNKVMWVILIAVLGLLGSLLYVVMARPALSRATS